MDTTSAPAAKQPRIHYAWVVMVAFGLVMSGTLGSLTVLAGLFIFPVTEELGFDLSSFTLYLNFTIVVLALTMPLIGNLMTKIKLQHILTAAGVIACGALACMSFFTQLWQ